MAAVLRLCDGLLLGYAIGCLWEGQVFCSVGSDEWSVEAIPLQATAISINSAKFWTSQKFTVSLFTLSWNELWTETSRNNYHSHHAVQFSSHTCTFQLTRNCHTSACSVTLFDLCECADTISLQCCSHWCNGTHDYTSRCRKEVCLLGGDHVSFLINIICISICLKLYIRSFVALILYFVFLVLQSRIKIHF
jgi:hypothetical protein